MMDNPGQMRALLLLIALLGLEAVRSPSVKNFFKTAGGSANASINAAAHGGGSASGSPAAALDWHLLAYWGGGAILLLVLAGPFPNVVTAILILLIAEVLLVHWSDFASLLAIPTK